MGIKRALPVAAVLVTVLGTMLATGPAPAGAAGQSGRPGGDGDDHSGRQPLRELRRAEGRRGRHQRGQFPDAYSAIAAYINAHGGFDGRKLVMNYAEMNPAVAGGCYVVVHHADRGRSLFRRLRPRVPGLLPDDARHPGRRWIAPRCRDRQLGA